STAKGPTFDAAAGDLPAPIWAGAVSEKKGKGRLVVIGCLNFVSNEFLAMPDPKLMRHNMEVSRFPGNGEVVTNSGFWLSDMDKMIALSPAALDTARSAPVKQAMLAFWR